VSPGGSTSGAQVSPNSASRPPVGASSPSTASAIVGSPRLTG
jgi:hypothetical protein